MTTSQSRELACLFCGATDIHSEHVLARWLSKALKKGMGQTHFVLTTERGEWRAGILNLEVAAFCQRNCNGGWMSVLEKRVSPVLTRLALATRPQIILADDARLLATWAYKTLLTMIAWHDPNIIGRAEYRRFYRNRDPGPATMIWMGAYSGTKWAGRFKIEGHDLPGIGGRIDDAPSDSITATFNIFRSVFVVWRWLGINSVVGEDVPESDPDRHLGRIWPVGDTFLRIPPGVAFTDEEYATFTVAPEVG